MAGELFQQTIQIGKEVAYGTEVNASRILYCRDPVFTVEREPRLHKFATTTRDNVRNITSGPKRIGGTLILPVSAEIIELLLMGIRADVAGAGAAEDKTWTFTPGTTLNSATVEWHDGAREWTITGAYADSLRFAGSVGGENLLTAELFAKDAEIKAKTAGLTHRTPAVFEGWETQFFIDPAGAAGATAVTAALLSWDIALRNGLARKYFANNSQALGAITMSELQAEATLVIEASAAQAATEFANWIADTQRVVSLVFGDNEAIAATGSNEKVQINLPGKWTAVDLGQTDENTRAYQLTLNYMYDTALTYGAQVVVTTARATAWAA